MYNCYPHTPPTLTMAARLMLTDLQDNYSRATPSFVYKHKQSCPPYAAVPIPFQTSWMRSKSIRDKTGQKMLPVPGRLRKKHDFEWILILRWARYVTRLTDFPKVAIRVFQTGEILKVHSPVSCQKCGRWCTRIQTMVFNTNTRQWTYQYADSRKKMTVTMDSLSIEEFASKLMSWQEGWSKWSVRDVEAETWGMWKLDSRFVRLTLKTYDVKFLVVEVYWSMLLNTVSKWSMTSQR